MISRYKMPTQIEKIVDGGMSTQKPLSLTHRLESPHSALSHPGRLVRLLCAIVGIPISDVNGLRYNLAMSNTITP